MNGGCIARMDCNEKFKMKQFEFFGKNSSFLVNEFIFSCYIYL